MPLAHSQLGPDGAPVVLFLHGGGISSWMWHDVVAHLPAFRSVLIDLPGHGDSRDLRWRSLPETADQVAEIAAGLPAPRHLCGLSLGGYTGLLAVLRHPELFASAMFSGMHPGPMPRKWMMKAVNALTAPLVTRRFVARKTAKMLRVPPEQTEAFAAEAIRSRPASVRRAVDDVIDFVLPESPQKVPTRLHFAAGGREHAMVRNGLPVFTGRFPGSTSALVPGLGHGWSGEDPAAFAAMLRTHIAG